MPKLSNLEDLYGLSPTQQGMLFHSLSAPGSEIYFEQFCYTFRGNLCSAILRTAWRTVVERHPALRSSIHWEEADKPLQVVLKRVELPWQEFDWREVSLYALWIQYLVHSIPASAGFSIEQILAFERTAREMLVKGLDDVEVEYQAEEAEMATIFAGWQPLKRPCTP